MWGFDWPSLLAGGVVTVAAALVLWNGSSNVVDTSANSISIIRVEGRR